MGINFPASPSADQKFTSGKTLYTFTNGAWRASALATALPFNYLVNPNFQVSQQGPSTSSTVGAFPADQWQLFGPLIAGAVSGRSGVPGPPNNSPYGFVVTNNTLKPSLGAGEYLSFMQVMEGQRIAAFRWGTAAAQQVVLRFWVLSTGASSTAVYGGSLRNTAVGAYRSYTFSFTVPSAAVWTKYEIVIPGDTTGSWPNDNTGALGLWITPAAATTYVTAPDKWTAGSFLAPNGTTNFVAIQNSLYFSDFGLYLDPDKTGRAPPWEPPLGERLVTQECQRYWNRVMIGRGTFSTTLLAPRTSTPYPVQMRIAPALAVVGAPTIYDGAANPAISSISAQTSEDIFEANITPASAVTAFRASFMPNNTSANYIASNSRM